MNKQLEYLILYSVETAYAPVMSHSPRMVKTALLKYAKNAAMTNTCCLASNRKGNDA